MKAFLSSTYLDLVECRPAAGEAIQRLDAQVGAMEVFGACPAEATVASLDEVDTCDLFVGIYAHRYGALVPGSEMSITEAEYRSAQKTEKPCFCFLVAEDYPWQPKQIEHRRVDKLEDFKPDLRQTLVVETFRDPTDLAFKVAASIGPYLREVAEAKGRPYGFWRKRSSTAGSWSDGRKGRSSSGISHSRNTLRRQSSPSSTIAGTVW